MENTQEKERTPINRGRCRKISGQRRNDPHRRNNDESVISSTSILLALAATASMISPVMAASLHQTCTAPERSVGSMTRRERRASGERNVRQIVVGQTNKNSGKQRRSGHKFFESLTNQHRPTYITAPDRYMKVADE